MKEKILLFLKTKLQADIVKYGVPETYLSGVAETWSKTITNEKDIEATFTDGIIETLRFTASQLQIEGDKRINQAKLDLKTWQKEHGLNEDGTPVKKETKKKKDVETDPDEPAWFTAYKKEQQESNEALKAEIETQKQEKTLAALSERVSKHEKLKDIPASYLKGRNLVPKSEADIDQLVASIETDYNGFKQEMAEKGVVISVPPTGGGQQGDKVTITDYLDEKFPKEPKGKVLIKK